MEAPKKQKWKETKKGKTFCKLYVCFRPVTMDGVSMEIEGDDHHRKGDIIVNNYLDYNDDYNNNNNKDDGDIGSKLSSPPYYQSKREIGKKACKRSLSRLVKVVMFGASLAKKMKKRELLQKIYKANGSVSSTTKQTQKDYIPRKSKKTLQDHQLSSPTNTCSPTSSTLCSSCNSSRISSSAPPASSSSFSLFCPSCNSSTPTSNASTLSGSSSGYPSFLASNITAKQELRSNNSETEKGLHGSNVGLGVVLLVLLFVVVWGKTCAILCTAACLFLVPKRSHSWGNVAVWKGDDSKEYKKRIIMGGILDRKKN